MPTPTHIWPTAVPQLLSAGLPEPEGHRIRRMLFVPTEIASALTRIVDLPKVRSVLQRYLSGGYVTGSMVGDPKKRHPDFERLERIDEVWMMCFRQPKFDQWRLMGRFAGFNTFVGLALFRREYLDGKKKYHGVAGDFAGRWPHAGPNAVPVHIAAQ